MTGNHKLSIFCGMLALLFIVSCKNGESKIDWPKFLAQHDMYWNEITTDPEGHQTLGKQRRGYYAGALMGNGLLGTNLYKLKDGVYRLNVGRSDVTELRQPYCVVNASRLPIGYFTFAPKGKVCDEELRLSLYDAASNGTIKTDKGELAFRTYVHSTSNIIVFEADTKGEDMSVDWDFVPLKAISPAHVVSDEWSPSNYVNKDGNSNPEPYRADDEDISCLVQPLALDSGFVEIGGAYAVAWKVVQNGAHMRALASVGRGTTPDEARQEAIAEVRQQSNESESKLYNTHTAWWHDFYQNAAFLTFPDARIESFYWAQYYKFASTARPGKPILDLQGVWPSYDTPWPAIWMNLNIQLTYSWQTKANLGWLAQPLWDSMWEHRDNLTRNVTDIPSQEDWTDAACLPRTCTYDLHAPLDPSAAAYNAYEVGNLAWILHYYWLQCNAYGDMEQMRDKLFPLLKKAVNIFFHLRYKDESGHYNLPVTASPEYNFVPLGPNCSYDLANLRQGLTTLLRIDSICDIHDAQRAEWEDFLQNLVPFPYDDETGFRVSQNVQFIETDHRHYSHLFMIYPYMMLDWNNPLDRARMELSINRWHGNQGYSRTGKAAMLANAGRGDEALEEFQVFMKDFLMPNTLYGEWGPVIETPLAAMSSLHEFYMQDWGDAIRVFYGVPQQWKDASFENMRAQGAYLVSATRKDAKTVFVEVLSEKGGVLNLQTDIPMDQLKCTMPYAKKNESTIQISMKPGEKVRLTDSRYEAAQPSPLCHPENEANPFGQRK